MLAESGVVAAAQAQRAQWVQRAQRAQRASVMSATLLAPLWPRACRAVVPPPAPLSPPALAPQVIFCALAATQAQRAQRVQQQQRAQRASVMSVALLAPLWSRACRAVVPPPAPLSPPALAPQVVFCALAAAAGPAPAPVTAAAPHCQQHAACAAGRDSSCGQGPCRQLTQAPPACMVSSTRLQPLAPNRATEGCRLLGPRRKARMSKARVHQLRP